MFKTKKQEIAEYYASLETHEIVDRYLHGDITAEARNLALTELSRRGVDPSDPSTIAKAEAAAQQAAYQRTNTAPTVEEISRQETGQFIVTILMIVVIPIIAWFCGYVSESNLQQQFVRAVHKQYGAAGINDIQAQGVTLAKYCESQGAFKEQVCSTLQHITWLQSGSIAILAVGIGLLIAIVVVSRLASNNRQLLLSLFSPFRVGMLFVLFVLILLQGAIASYGAYLLESTTIHRIHYFVIGSIAIGAFIGAFTMIEAGFSISRNLTTSIIGKPFTKDQQPQLWAHIEDTAKKLGSATPSNLVLGLEPNFFVTAAGVDAYPGPSKQSGTTLYLSLPLMRILSISELTAVIGHELGHFRGKDTEFSLRFYPIYAGTAQALQALGSDGEGKQRDFGFKSIGLIPATALLSFFMNQFAKAERKIGRERELEADQAGASVSSPKALATSLIKVAAFAPAWGVVRSAMVEALSEKKAYTNTSAMFQEIANSNARLELFESVGASVAVHPTDTHPPTDVRVAALGQSMNGFQLEDLKPGEQLIDTSASLVKDLIGIEEELSAIEHQALAMRRG